FHMLGLYPNAGHDYYLIHSPLVEWSTLSLPNGNKFTIKAINFDPAKRPYIVGARLNGVDYPLSTISHRDIVTGGTLELTMGAKPTGWGREMFNK
ncbi:MAG: glycoside hydrolase family 92 protein, partial [Muribaculaceae bacterium]|nr:glycoside hydrolase family 92 protein [Muribaculaceae bacterium]